jgi:hypothetical protein
MSTPQGPIPGGQPPQGQQPTYQPPAGPPPTTPQPTGGGGYPPGQQPYPGDPSYGPPSHGHQGPGVQERAAQAFQNVGRHVSTPETKEFYKTSEFAIWLLTVLGILIAGATIGGGNDDEFRAGAVWTLITATSFAYIISRGISKAGTRRGHNDNRTGGPPY